MTKYIIHIVINGEEEQRPIAARSLDEANAHAEMLEARGYKVNRVRMHVTGQ